MWITQLIVYELLCYNNYALESWWNILQSRASLSISYICTNYTQTKGCFLYIENGLVYRNVAGIFTVYPGQSSCGSFHTWFGKVSCANMTRKALVEKYTTPVHNCCIIETL